MLTLAITFLPWNLLYKLSTIINSFSVSHWFKICLQYYTKCENINCGYKHAVVTRKDVTSSSTWIGKWFNETRATKFVQMY